MFVWQRTEISDAGVQVAAASITTLIFRNIEENVIRLPCYRLGVVVTYPKFMLHHSSFMERLLEPHITVTSSHLFLIGLKGVIVWLLSCFINEKIKIKNKEREKDNVVSLNLQNWPIKLSMGRALYLCVLYAGSRGGH